MEERNRVDEKIRNKLGQVWDKRKLEEDRGLKTMLGLKDKNEEVIKYTKEFLMQIWRKRNKKATLKKDTIETIEHNYVRRN